MIVDDFLEKKAKERKSSFGRDVAANTASLGILGVAGAGAAGGAVYGMAPKSVRWGMRRAGLGPKQMAGRAIKGLALPAAVVAGGAYLASRAKNKIKNRRKHDHR